MATTRLSPEYRESALRRACEGEFDVLVVGGGVVGTGAALDAASRGLSTVLIEAQDWGAGTSGRSSKLVHGGLRYLEQRDFSLVREALKERALLLHRLAPHLVRPVPFLLPLQGGPWERAYIGAGVLLYDTIGGARALPAHRHLSRRSALELAPSLRPDALTGAIRYYDAQVDDARHTMMLARTAAQHGAVVLSRARMTSLLRAGDRVVGAEMRDTENDREYTVRARRVISAAGVWTDEISQLCGAEQQLPVRMSKGVHILVDRHRLDMDTGMILRTKKSVLFVIPWGRHWIIGTTDTEWAQEKEHPRADRHDVDYLLARTNAVLRIPLTRADIVGVYAGLRPLLSGGSDETTKLSREHAVAELAPGLFAIAGGKYTTYRVMAADVVDAAVGGLGREVPASLTERIPIAGAVGYHELRDNPEKIAGTSGLSAAASEHLINRHGSLAAELVECIAQRPELAEPVPSAEPHLKAEFVYAASHEGALTLQDVLVRRTRIAMEQADGGLAAASEISELIGPILGWDDVRTKHEVAAYADWVDAERTPALLDSDTPTPITNARPG